MFSVLQNITAPIFYITNDVTKGLGLEKLLLNYHLVCIDNHPVVDCLAKAGVNVFCLERELGKKNIIFRSSSKLLENPLVEKYIQKKAGRQTPWIMYFKPSVRIDLLCTKRGYRKIGNSVKLNRLFEDKISFHQICQKWGLPVVPGEITDLSQTDYSVLKKKYGDNLVIQFGRGWAGSTTFLIENEKQFNHLKENIGKRKVRITKFIDGKTVLNNCCLTQDKVLVSPPASQITAIPGFTSQKGGTCGRVWPAGIDKKRDRDIEILSKKIGEKMRKEGYLGYFGLDFLIEEKTGKIYLSENNARLTASAPFYSKLEMRASKVPLLAHHVSAFLDKRFKGSKVQRFKITGSELIVRNDKDESILIRKDFKPGIYQIKAGKLNFVREAHDIEGVKKESEFFLTTAAKGRVVNPEMEMARFNSLENILEINGQLKEWVVKMLLEVKKSLWLF